MATQEEGKSKLLRQTAVVTSRNLFHAEAFRMINNKNGVKWLVVVSGIEGSSWNELNEDAQEAIVNKAIQQFLSSRGE